MVAHRSKLMNSIASFLKPSGTHEINDSYVVSPCQDMSIHPFEGIMSHFPFISQSFAQRKALQLPNHRLQRPCFALSPTCFSRNKHTRKRPQNGDRGSTPDCWFDYGENRNRKKDCILTKNFFRGHRYHNYSPTHVYLNIWITRSRRVRRESRTIVQLTRNVSHTRTIL